MPDCLVQYRTLLSGSWAFFLPQETQAIARSLRLPDPFPSEPKMLPTQSLETSLSARSPSLSPTLIGPSSFPSG